MHLFEPIEKGTVYVTYSVEAPVDLPQSTIVPMHVEGRLLQVCDSHPLTLIRFRKIHHLSLKLSSLH